ncbi:MAG: histidine phosphatase family protein [Methanomassiliicoccales archaeon]|jgi:hypothetical protein
MAEMTDNLRILEDLKAVPEGTRCILIIRHSDRDGSLDKLCPNGVGLNAKGVEKAVRLGKEIAPRPLSRMLSSPAVRCIQTCEHVSEGQGGATAVQLSRFLGMEGPFILRTKEAVGLMTSMGFVPFVEGYVREELDEEVLMPCRDMVARLFSWGACRMRSVPIGLSVAVTHDLVITPLLVQQFGYDLRGKGLIGFLDGFVLFESDHSLIARHGGKEVDVTSLVSGSYD